MKTRILIVALALALGACKARNERPDLAITSVIAPTASVSGSGATAGLSCAFTASGVELSELPYNPNENRGSIAVVIQNSLQSTVSVRPGLSGETTTFLPHQAVVSYEFIPGSAGNPPGENVVPAGGQEVPNASKGVVGFDVFRGVAISVPANTIIRVTMHVEGKLLDGSLVHTSEREYLFRACSTPGCGAAGPWAATVNGTLRSCL